MIKFGNTFVNFGGAYLTGYKEYDPYNPLDLPDNTIRVKFSSDYTPPSYIGDTQTLVDSVENIWDIYKQSNEWVELLCEGGPEPNNHHLLEVLGANTKNVTNMRGVFDNCRSLTTVSLFDTSNVTNMAGMFYNCYELTSVPLFVTNKVTLMPSMFYGCDSLTTVPLLDTSNVTNMNSMFAGCDLLISVPLFNTSNVTDMFNMFCRCESLTYIPLFDTSKVIEMGKMFQSCFNVQSGALALYQQASSQANPPTGHDRTFNNCGINTQTGSAELAQIQADWK